MVKTTEVGKIGIVSIFVIFDYVNRFAYPLFSNLWKSPVDKAVENVEKCEFSTAIFAFCNALHVVDKTE